MSRKLKLNDAEFLPLLRDMTSAQPRNSRKCPGHISSLASVAPEAKERLRQQKSADQDLGHLLREAAANAEGAHQALPEHFAEVGFRKIALGQVKFASAGHRADGHLVSTQGIGGRAGFVLPQSA